ncbi:hypothetical protein TWF696_000061 [Orbilia brochopaga]|uniref:Uncharacterized protein n=1 Tax=Orbilia brochopaga TaxID=3140254 RepID=A0AAV9VD95_9PEZI
MTSSVNIIHALNLSPDWSVKYHNEVTGRTYTLPKMTPGKIPCSEYHKDPLPHKDGNEDDKRLVVELNDTEFKLCHDEQKRNVDLALNIYVDAAQNSEPAADQDSYVVAGRTIKINSIWEYNYIVELYKVKINGQDEGLLNVQDGAIDESQFNELVDAKKLEQVDVYRTQKLEPKWIPDDNTRLGGHWGY